MLKAFLTLIAGLLFITVYSTDIISVNNTDVRIIGKDVLYFEDETKVLSLNQAVQLSHSGEFETCDKDVFAKPSSPSAHWFTFTVESLVEDELWINVVNQGFNEINFHLFNEQGDLINSLNTGVEVPNSTRMRRSKTFWFNLFEDEELGIKTVFLQIKFSGILEVPILLGGYEELVEVEDESELYSIMFVGGLLVMLMYNSFLGIFTKDIVYLYYTGYILSMLLITTHVNNYPLMPSIFGSYFTYQFLFVWIAPVAIFMALFIIRYLELDKYARKAAIAIRIFAVISFAIGFSNIFIPTGYLTNAYQVSTVLLLTVCMVVGFKQWANGRRRAKFYSIGWTINIISVLVFMAVSNGLMTYNPLSRNSMYFGVFCELVIFSIALAERLNELKNKQGILNEKLAIVNENLVVSNESLDSFNYHVSHDLKTVMNNSNALAQMITKYNERDDKERVKEIAEKLFVVTKNGGETVQSFLSLGRVNDILRSEGETSIELKKELYSIIDRNDLNDGICVTVLTDQIGTLTMHKKAFESVFLNLITNAIKYNSKEARAEVQFITDTKNYIFIFSDNGIGIDTKKYGNVIFEPFQRGDYTEGQEGTGVGLYLVKRIITAYKGEISVESELGNGTTFTIRIPRER